MDMNVERGGLFRALGLFAAGGMAAVAFSLGAVAGGAQVADVFVGSGGVGHTTPAAAAPFGMVQAGPDTSRFADSYEHNWEHCSGYQYGDGFLWRFSQLHLSGTGVSSLGNLGLFPYAEEPTNGIYSTKILKSTERGEPGYYAVSLENGKVACEMTVSARRAYYRFAYGEGERMKLLLDNDWGMQPIDGEHPAPVFGRRNYQSEIVQVTPTEYAGHLKVRSWSTYDLYWAVAFSRPVVAERTVAAATGRTGEIRSLDFGPRGDGRLEVRLALSTESVADARAALAGGRTFDVCRRETAAEWRRYLGRLTLDEDTDPQVAANFRAALYRTLFQPNLIAEGEYSTFSLWDTFRAAHPLYTLVCPERVPGFVDSMLAQYDRQGYLPIWALMGKETHCMIGHHAVPVVVDAVLKGLLPREQEARAYAAVRDSLRNLHRPDDNTFWGLTNEDWDKIDRYGYLPFDAMSPTMEGSKVIGQSVSRTLECAYDDACAAKLARRLGKDEDAEFFARRAGNWRNVFDESVGFVRGRDAQGKWREQFDPYAIGHNWFNDNDFTEGNSWQYTWHVMQDPEGLVAALGGKAKAGAKLEELFTVDPRKVPTAEGTWTGDVTGLIGQYAHGNEPSHHTAYFFRFTDRQQLTEKYVREICDSQYHPTPDGLCGNDDCGQMAAWYVFSAMGFYPFDPCGGDYVLGAPQVTGATLKLPGGKTFRVVAKNLSKENRYVKRVTLNGKELKGYILRHAEIMRGGELVFEMTGE